LANADALAARQVIEQTLHDAVKAADKAVHDAQDAVKAAQKALNVVKVGGDATAIANAQTAVNNAITAANTARANREQVRTDALKAYNDAISALGHCLRSRQSLFLELVLDSVQTRARTRMATTKTPTTMAAKRTTNLSLRFLEVRCRSSGRHL